nr:hypothetical protein CFP56_04339 [Quercus suber]
MVPGLTESRAHEILKPVIQFEDGWGYERVQAMTNFRKDDGEARILYTCKRVSQSPSQSDQSSVDESFVMKVKVQVPSLLPGGQKEPLFGPSEQSLAELKALQTFRDKQRSSVPHLISWKRITQGADSLFPGGYIAFTVMTLMPGDTLLDLGFWSNMSVSEQEEIRIAFIATLKDVWRDGFEPYDCALRNILWKRETKQCSIVDFEHYNQAKDPINMNENEELQKWGLVRRPPSTTWWAEWGLK